MPGSPFTFVSRLLRGNPRCARSSARPASSSAAVAAFRSFPCAASRSFSFRSASHGWDPKAQRPELWRLYNTRIAKGESIRVFPLSNWTELDIWQYILAEGIEIVPRYFAAPRPTVERDGMLLMVDDERFRFRKGEVAVDRSIRFRTLGCYPLTGAVESGAATLPDVIQEMLLTTTSERQGRAIDHDQAASMEKKKREGYF